MLLSMAAGSWNGECCSMHVLRYRAPPGGQHNSPAMDGTCGFGALVPSGSSLAGSRVPGRGDLSALSHGASSRVSYPKQQSLASPWSAPALLPQRASLPSRCCVNCCILHSSKLAKASMLPFAPDISLGPHPAPASPTRSHDRAPVA